MQAEVRQKILTFAIYYLTNKYIFFCWYLNTYHWKWMSFTSVGVVGCSLSSLWECVWCGGVLCSIFTVGSLFWAILDKFIAKVCSICSWQLRKQSWNQRKIEYIYYNESSQPDSCEKSSLAINLMSRPIFYLNQANTVLDQTPIRRVFI